MARKILIVEDNPLNLELVQDILSDAGYEVLGAEDGLTALKIVREELPALVLMDVQLPGLDGLEVTRRLLLDPATARIPIVALTAHAMPGEQEKALQAGCAGFITKPIEVGDFEQKISAFLDEVPERGD